MKISKRTLLLCVVVGVSSFLGATAIGANASRYDRQNVRGWVDSAGRVDKDAIPERIRFGTDLSPTGAGWIKKADFLDDTEGRSTHPTPLYSAETGGHVIGTFDPSTGIHTPVGGGKRAVENSTTPTTAVQP